MQRIAYTDVRYNFPNVFTEEKIIEKYSCMDTADAGAGIVIHMKAGISRYDESLKLLENP